MIITNNDRQLLETILANQENLEAILKMPSIKAKQAKDLQMKESVTFAGITWSKFAEHENGHAFVLADSIIKTMAFGEYGKENNNWIYSKIRAYLYDNLYNKIIDDLGDGALCSIVMDLSSRDGSDFKESLDTIFIPTYNMYRNNRENIKQIDDPYWLATSFSAPSPLVLYVDSDCVRYKQYNEFTGIRPVCLLKSDAFFPYVETKCNYSC